MTKSNARKRRLRARKRAIERERCNESFTPTNACDYRFAARVNVRHTVFALMAGLELASPLGTFLRCDGDNSILTRVLQFSLPSGSHHPMQCLCPSACAARSQYWRAVARGFEPLDPADMPIFMQDIVDDRRAHDLHSTLVPYNWVAQRHLNLRGERVD